MGFFKKLFRRSKLNKDQQAEMDYRVALSEVRRQAATMQKEVDRCRNEAYRLEISGNHAAAVSKAAEAANSEKAYEAALNTLHRCESMHAQARNQKILTNLMTACENMSENLINQVDMDGALRLQTKLQQTNAVMEEVQESMTAFQEGFEPNTAPALRMAAGEDALAEIMATRAVQEAEVLPPAEAAEMPAGASEDIDMASHAEWLREKRRELADIA